MNAAHVHLFVNHIPIWGVVFGLIVLIWAMVRRNADIRRVAMVMFALSGLVAIVAYLTGGGAEDVIRNMPGFAHDLVEEHEEAGLVALVSALILGVVAAIALVPRLARSKALDAVILILAVIVVGIFLWTAALGGQIRHPELRPVVEGVEQGTDGTLNDNE